MKIKNIILSIILILILIQSSSAGIVTYGSGSLTTNSGQFYSFKCQPVYIYANFTNYANITSVYALFDNKHPQPMLYGIPQQGHQEFLMTDTGTGHYTLTYANTNITPAGNKYITFRAYDGISNQSFNSGLKLVIAPDVCSGSDLTNYTQLSSGLGHYTSNLFNGKVNIVELGTYYWVEMFGYVFYIIILTMVCFMIYSNTKTIMPPFIVAFVVLLGLITTNSVPGSWIAYILLMGGIAICAIFYRMVTRE